MKTILAAASVAILWGSGWLFIKLSVSNFPPFLFGGTRNLLAGAILLGIALLQKQKGASQRQILTMAGMGILMTGVSNGFTFWAQQRISSSLAALVWCCMPFFTVVFSHFGLPGHRINAWKLVGLALGLSGVWLVLSTQNLDLGAGANEGKAAIVIAAFIWSLALVLNKRLLPDASSTLMTGVQLAAGSLYLLPVGLIVERGAPATITPLSVSIFVMMVLGQGIVAYLCYYYLMAKVSPTSVSMMSFITPSIAVMLGVVILHEPLVWQMGAGLALVTVGIVIVNLLGYRPKVAT